MWYEIDSGNKKYTVRTLKPIKIITNEKVCNILTPRPFPLLISYTFITQTKNLTHCQ